MKCVPFSFAALLITTTVAAQPTVTVFGRLEAGLRSHTQSANGVRTATGNRGLEQNSSGLSGTRWGLRGREELGGGWRTVFNLEQGFLIDTGDYSNTQAQFSRQAYVGIGGPYGTVTLGYQFTMIDFLLGFHDAQSASTNSAMFYAYSGGAACLNGATTNGGGTGLCGGRFANSIVYGSPTVDGLRALMMYAPGEDKNVAMGKRASNYLGAFANYDNGRTAAGLGWQRLKTSDVTQPSGYRSTSTLGLSGSYSFPFGKVFVGLERGNMSTSSASDFGWSIGVTTPVGPMNLALGYAFERTIDAAGARGGNRALAGQLVYPLSKRTNVYGYFLSGYSDVTAGNMANAVTAFGLPAGVITGLTGFTVGRVKNNWLGVGIRHEF